jgi:hypothetical protein
MDLRTADVEGLIEAIKAAGMESPTIFIDTLNRAAPGADENSSSDMGLGSVDIASCLLCKVVHFAYG